MLAGVPPHEPRETVPASFDRLRTGCVEEPIPWHDDYPQPETLDGWAMVLAAHEVMGSVLTSGPPPWWVHQIVDADEVVGDIGFHGPPAYGAARTAVVEIGYNVVPARRRQGLATRACAMIIELAWRDGADRVVAVTDPYNVGSQQVLLRNGFRQSFGGGFSLERPR